MRFALLLLMPIYCVLDIVPLVAGALISGAASLGGSLLEASSARRANQISIDLANTAHQREVADLLKAGLNPILSATGGNGAAVPNIQQEIQGNPLAEATQSVYAAKRFAEIEKKQSEAQVKLADSQSKKNDADSDVAKATLGQIGEQIKTMQTQQLVNGAAATRELANAKYADGQTALLQIQAEATAAQADYLRKQGIKLDYDTEESRLNSEFWKSGYGNAYRYVKPVLDMFGFNFTKLLGAPKKR